MASDGSGWDGGDRRVIAVVSFNHAESPGHICALILTGGETEALRVSGHTSGFQPF